MTVERTASTSSDIIKELGVLAFASRLKRLGERLQRDVSRLYVARELQFEARWFPVLYALKQGNASAVTPLAQRLGLTHPAVNQIAGQMERHGLLTSRRDKRDERRRLLRLSAKGKRLAGQLESIWEEIRVVTTEVLDGTGCDVLAVLDKIEAAFDERDVYERVLERGGRRGRVGVSGRANKHRHSKEM